MKEVQELYLSLLRSALWGYNCERLEVGSERLNEVINLAAFQGTGPLIYDQLLKQKDFDIPTALRMQIKQQCLQSMMLQQLMCGILSRAWKALVSADIHPVLLKGFSIAQYYPQPHLRQWGDIDLYVGKKQYHKACEVLRNALPEAKHPKEEFEFLKHYNFVFDNTVLEMHRISMDFHHPRDSRYYEQLEDRYLDKEVSTCDINGLSIIAPEDTFNVFFVFLHAWHHFFETGMNMKQLCDIAILLHVKREDIGKEQLRKMLSKLHLLEVWQLVMYIIVHHLGLPQKECPFYSEKDGDCAELLFERIMREGSARKVESEESRMDSISYLKRKWITLKSRVANSRIVKSYAPHYARHMLMGDILHGIERTIKGSERAVNVECV